MLFKSIEELESDAEALFQKYKPRLAAIAREHDDHHAATMTLVKKAKTATDVRKVEAASDEKYREMKIKADALVADFLAEHAEYQKLFKRSRRFIIQLGSR